MFAQGSVSSKSSTGKRIPPFKLIVLDEADSLTSSAQVIFCFETHVDLHTPETFAVSRFYRGELCRYSGRVN